jgi:hypothetical protein
MKRKLGRISAQSLDELKQFGKEARFLTFSDEEWGRIADLPLEDRRKWMAERKQKTGHDVSWLFRVGDRVFDTLTREGKAEIDRLIDEDPKVEVYVCLDDVWDLNGDPSVSVEEYEKIVLALRFVDRVFGPQNPNRPSIN